MSVEHGTTSERQVYEAAVAAIPDQGSRKKHLLAKDLKKALGGLPGVDTSDAAIDALLGKLASTEYRNLEWDEAKGTYKIIDRTPKTEGGTADTDGDDDILDLLNDDADDGTDTPLAVDTVSTSPVDSGTDDDPDDILDLLDDNPDADTSSSAPAADTASSRDTGGSSPDSGRDTSPSTSTADEPASDTPSAEPPTPTVDPTARYSERRFNRWSKQVQESHARILKVFAELDKKAKIEDLKEEFKHLTGRAWSEDFPLQEFLAEKSGNRIDIREDEATKHATLTASTEAQRTRLLALLQEGLPEVSAGGRDRELSELISHIKREGADPEVALTEFIEDLRDEYAAEFEGNTILTEKKMFIVLARLVDRVELAHMKAKYDNMDENPPELQAARDKFLQAQEDFNQFERKLVRNPFTSKKRRRELTEALEEARNEYNTESAKVIAGRSHRFLNEFNTQIDREIAIRNDRKANRGWGDTAMEKMGTLRDKCYGFYKFLGNQSVDKAERMISGSEPSKGRWWKKALNLRTVAGIGLTALGVGKAWRLAAGAGVGIGVYEGLKAKKTAELQTEAHALLAEQDQSKVEESKIYELLQQMRMRAALEGKTVEDINFSLGESFTKLRALLEKRQKDVEPEDREQAYINADAINSKLDAINSQLETQMTEQSASRRKQALAGITAGGAVIVAGPVVAKYLGIAADQVGEWLGIVGDTVPEAHGVSPLDIPESTPQAIPEPDPTPEPTPEPAPQPPPELGPKAGITATVERGEGAYHAIYDLMDQLSESDKQAFAQAVAEEHPEWARTDASGNITNVDRVLRNWRVEAVNNAHLDNGSTVSVYNAASREYGVGLRPGAQFSLEYSADGYPELHLDGTEQSGNYRIHDTAVVRYVSPDGDVSFMPRDQVPVPETAPQVPPASVQEVATPVSSDMDLGVDGIPPAEIDIDSQVAGGGTAEAIVRDAHGHVLTQGDTPVGLADMPMQEGSVVADSAEMARTEPAEPISPPIMDEHGHFTEHAFPEGEPNERIRGIHGHEIEVRNHGNHLDVFYPEEDQVNMGQVQSELLTTTNITDKLDPFRSGVVDRGLHDVYVVDGVLEQMAQDGQQSTPEYSYLSRYVERRMGDVARAIGEPVGDVFDNDFAESYGYEAGRTAEELAEGSVARAPIPQAESQVAASATVEATASAEPVTPPEPTPRAPEPSTPEPREAPEVTPEVTPAPELDSALLDQVTQDVGEYSRPHALTVQSMTSEYAEGVRTWDSMTPEQQSAFSERVARIEDEFRAIVDTEARR